MAFATTTFVGPPTLASDGTAPFLRSSRTGDLIVQENGPRWMEPCLRNLMFTGSTPAAGVVVPIYTSTTQQCVLQNPQGSNVAFVLRKIYFGYVSSTQAPGNIVLAVATLPTSAITGTNSTTFIYNNKLTGTAPGAGNFAGSKALLYTAATVVAFTYYRSLAWGLSTMAATATNNPFAWESDIDGSIIMMPQAAIAVAANVAAATTAAIAIEWLEVPVTWVQ